MPIYSIAGLRVEMHPQHRLTAERAAEYAIADGEADLVLPMCAGDPNDEYAALAVALYAALPRFDGFLLHASAVELDGKAYLFSAPSGTGKSTHAAYWREELGALVINDDKPAIRLIDGVFHACGTPFCGKENRSRNVCVPLGGIAFLRRGELTRFDDINKRDALFRLLDQTVRPDDAASLDRMLTLIELLIDSVPLKTLYVPHHPCSAKEALAAFR